MAPMPHASLPMFASTTVAAMTVTTAATFSVCLECAAQSVGDTPAAHGGADQFLIYAKMYEIGDKYEVVGIKPLAQQKFSRACKHFWSTSDFPVAAHYAFSTTPEEDKGLRELVSTTIADHIELVEEPAVRVLLTQYNGLVRGILDAKIEEHGWGKESLTPHRKRGKYAAF